MRFKTTIILLRSHGFFGKLFFSKNNYESWVIWLKRLKKKDQNHPTIVAYFLKNINLEQKEQNNHESM